MPKAAKQRSKYRPHPGLAHEEASKRKLLEKTGRSFDDWIALARKKGPKTQRDCAAWLREEHELGSRDAWWLAWTATSTEELDYDDPESLVDALYSGAKGKWRALHEEVVDVALELGDDVVPTACKTMVPLYRKHVFAELRPATEGVEVRLALGPTETDARFENVARDNPGGRLTHRVLLRSAEDVDAAFKARLRTAYDHGAGKMERADGESKVPEDLAKAIARAPEAARTWEQCTPAMRRDWIVWIDSAKQSATRLRRVERAVDTLAAGKRKMY
jgi:hypothetical protein